MSRRYGDPIEVRWADQVMTAAAADAQGADSRGCSAAGDRAPCAFLWRDRVYVVRRVLNSWTQRVPWWRSAAADAEPSAVQHGAAFAPAPDTADASEPEAANALENQVWRVEASAGRTSRSGVYEITGSPLNPDAWRLLRVDD